MDINFIKWCCDNSRLEYRYVKWLLDGGRGLDEWNNVYYPFLLQRTIEGINKNFYTDGLQIIISPGYDYPWVSQIVDMQKCKEQMKINCNTADEAKEKALKHFMANVA